MTGVVIAIIVVAMLGQLPKLLGGRRATGWLAPAPLADRRLPMPAWSEAQDEEEIEPDESDSDEPAPTAPTPRRSAGRRAHYLLGGAPAAANTDRTRAMMDQFSAPGLCTPRKRRAR